MEETGESEALDIIASRKSLRALGKERTRRPRDHSDPVNTKWREAWEHPANRVFLEQDTLYARYLNTLEALFEEAEPEAPAWMRGEAWARKSTETALASWAQMRNALSLVAARGAFYLGLTEPPPGFVEPNPEFFGRMARLAADAYRAFDAAGVFNVGAIGRIVRLENHLSLLRTYMNANGGERAYIREHSHRPEWSMLLDYRGFEMNERWNAANRGWRTDEEWTDDDLAFIKACLNEDLRAEWKRLLSPESIERDSIAERWITLRELALTLESLAHKQLRGREWSHREAAFIRNYGKELAYVMLYDGNSWLTPVDDAPRVAGIHENPQAGQILHVAAGRPRTIYALYPWNGHKILCHGSVMPYFEFAHDHWMTDSEWRDREAAAEPPVWLER